MLALANVSTTVHLLSRFNDLLTTWQELQSHYQKMHLSSAGWDRWCLREA